MKVIGIAQDFWMFNECLGTTTNQYFLAEKLGYALVMDLAGTSVGSLRDGILKVAAVQNNSYRMAAKKRSSLLRELPISPRKLATWWVEHVATYKGAEHLKSSTRYTTKLLIVFMFFILKKNVFLWKKDKVRRKWIWYFLDTWAWFIIILWTWWHSMRPRCCCSYMDWRNSAGERYSSRLLIKRN